MKALKIIISLSLLLWTLPGFSKILFISDVDDTIKISHVLAVGDSVNNSVSIGNHFLGMSQTYKMVSQNQETFFAYVSNAPASVMQYSHQAFLLRHSFPAGQLLLKPSQATEHKQKTITRLIQEAKPEQVILLGDNGEEDSVIYSKIQKQFPEIPMTTFIHLAYSVQSTEEPGNPLAPEQIGYVTSVDLSQELFKRNLISSSGFQKLLQTTVSQILDEPLHLVNGELAFPEWMDCRDYRPQNILNFSAPIFPVKSSPRDEQELLAKYQQKVERRCR